VVLPPIEMFPEHPADHVDVYTPLAYNSHQMEFVEASVFTRHLRTYMDDDGYRSLQQRLVANPEAGAVMPGTGGFRKLRWADPRRGKGRRGGLRVIYFHFSTAQVIWLMTLYDKDEAADLSPSEKKALKAALELELRIRKEKNHGKAKYL